MRTICVAIVIGMLFCRSDGQGPGGGGFLSNLYEDIHRLTQNVQQNVQELNGQIQKNLAELQKSDFDIAQTIGSDSSRIIINGKPITVIANGGTSRVVFLNTSDGKPQFYSVQDSIVGDTIQRIESVYDPDTKTVKETRYTKSLKDPNAEFVPVKE